MVQIVITAEKSLTDELAQVRGVDAESHIRNRHGCRGGCGETEEATNLGGDKGVQGEVVGVDQRCRPGVLGQQVVASQVGLPVAEIHEGARNR